MVAGTNSPTHMTVSHDERSSTSKTRSPSHLHPSRSHVPPFRRVSVHVLDGEFRETPQGLERTASRGPAPWMIHSLDLGRGILPSTAERGTKVGCF